MRRALLGAFGILALTSSVGIARDALPWKDANPLEGSRTQPRERRAQVPKAPKPEEVAAPAATGRVDVPVPEARPGGAVETSDVPLPVVKGEAAMPDPRPPGPETSKAPMPDAAAATSPPAPADPAAAARLPVTEIPVPDERPKPSLSEAAPAPGAEPRAERPAASPPPSAETPPSEPEAAPNSTEKLKSREPAVTPAASVEAAAAVEDAVACETELKKRGAEFTVETTVSEGECGVLRPVAVKRLSSGVEVSPKTQMLCRTALALDDWMTASVVPAAKAEIPGDRLTEFRHASTYVCRPRASETGISEHARGSAIDIGSFVFSSGREIGIAAKDAGSPDATFLDAVRTGACGPFKTVLGPGTDGDHTTHFHLDIAARTNAATYCK